MDTRRELRTGLRLLIMALVFLALSCESGGDSGDCLGGGDGLIAGCSDGCGTGMTMTGSNSCLGGCMFGGDGGCGGCGAGEACNLTEGCGGCEGCDDVGPYAFPANGTIANQAIQVHVTNSLFQFVSSELLDILRVAAGDMINIAPDGKLTYCLEPNMDISVAKLCTSGFNCHIPGTPGTGNNGCAVDLRIKSLNIVPVAPNRIEVRAKISNVYGQFETSVITGTGCSRLKVSMDNNKEVSATIGTILTLNPANSATEIYIGGNAIDIDISALKIDISKGNAGNGWDSVGCTITGWAVEGIINGMKGTIVNEVQKAIGAITCRGCNSNADCGAGATCNTSSKVCQYPSSTAQGRLCQGVQIGADAKIDAGGLLESFAPGTEGALGVRAFLGNYADSVPNVGLQLAGMLGATAAPSSMCVPLRPSPLTPGDNNCRTGTTCPKLAQLNSGDTINGETFHIGAAVAMGGLNNALWAAYNSGLLCLSIGGEQIDMLSSDLIATFVSSLGSLTMKESRPVMIQLRPQEEPRVSFKKDTGNGATVVVELNNIELDFYTFVDERYVRVFTLRASLTLPLSVKTSGGSTIALAIGDLTQAIDPANLEVKNVQMVSPAEVQSLVNQLPSLIGSLAGGLLGEDTIPPIDIPELMPGLTIGFVGPGITIIEEGGLASAIGLFLKMNIDAEALGGALNPVQPRIVGSDITIPEPNALREELAARVAADGVVHYLDLMPSVRLTVDVEGEDLTGSDAEYAWSINRGPWSFWQEGPVLEVNDPRLAVESRYEIRVAARRIGDPNSGSNLYDTVNFVVDRTQPDVVLDAQGRLVTVTATDNIYDVSELTMAYRVNGGSWSAPSAVKNIDVAALLAEGEVMLDVRVTDPSGNSRTARRSFGAGETSDLAAPAASAALNDTGCSSSQGSGGLVALIGLLGLVAWRRRSDRAAVAASSPHVAIAILAILMLGVFSSGCGKKKIVSVCDPECGAHQMCIASVCEPILCQNSGDCPAGLPCKDGVCQAAEACEDDSECPVGKFCGDDDRCLASECTVAQDCSNSCPAGDGAFCDYDQDQEAGQCLCAAKLKLGAHGSWLNVMSTADGAETYALTYAANLGDLIFGELAADGKFEWIYIDGVPFDNAPNASPLGARGGIMEPGEVAGQYVSAVLEERADGTKVIHAAYQVAAAPKKPKTDLRYARGVQNGKTWAWTFVTVDTFDNTGYGVKIFLDETVTPGTPAVDPTEDNPEGTPATADAQGGIAIIYGTTDIVVPGEPDEANPNAPVPPTGFFGNVNVAYSVSRDPAAPADFALSEIDQGEDRVPCGGSCSSREVCIAATNSCEVPAKSCEPACEGATACVKKGEVSSCEATATIPFRANILPKVYGLFPSVLQDESGTVHLAFYDGLNGNLVYTTLAFVDGVAQLVSAPVIVDGETTAGKSLGDIGRWTNVQRTTDGKIVIFYQDASRSALKAAVLTGGNSASIFLLDNGLYRYDDHRKVELNRVGENPVVLMTDDGFDVYYHDATRGVTRLVRWNNLGAAPTVRGLVALSAPGAAADLVEHDLVDADAKTFEDPGAYGAYLNIVQSSAGVLFASKRTHLGSGKEQDRDVRTIFVAAEQTDDGDDTDEDGGETP